MSLQAASAVPTQPATNGDGALTPTLPPELQKAMSRVTEISSLPEITARIVEVVEDPKATAQHMHEIVKNDPALAAKILKVVNSSFYGLPAQIASLDRAIVMLGLSAVKNIALAASLSRLFKPGEISEHFAARDLWKHCIAVGVCTKLLGRAGHADRSEEAFVAGLMHDMGLLVEHQLFPDGLKEITNRCHAKPQVFCAAEDEIIGANHQMFGAALAAKWKFPAGLRCAVAYHHNPENLRPEYRCLTTLVYVADTICSHNQIGFWLTTQLQEISDDALALINLDRERLAEAIVDLPERVEEAEQIFSQ
ncbi:MAG: HDOD domain-containing protein [Planctomycetes bacterium]|nr:HDOD domain-containing protein [Planctomycetota bacterium]